MRAALALLVLLTLTVSGCLGVDNMGQLKAALGFGPPAPLEPGAPLARIRASATMVPLGQAVALSAQGSSDPQGLRLVYAWDFGDGLQAQGSEATHRWSAAGIYTVRQTARSPTRLAGLDTVLITVLDNRPPSAAMEVRKDGQPADRALAGEALQFLATVRDPEGAPLAVRWDFGDGTTALTPDATHSYAHGGRYAIALRAEDPAGLAATAEQALSIDEVRSYTGTLSITSDARGAHPLDVAAQAQGVQVKVHFDPLLGLNALRISLLDAQGAEVKAWDAAPQLGAQRYEAVFDLDAGALQGHAPGSWTLSVARAAGPGAAYDLTAAVQY